MLVPSSTDKRQGTFRRLKGFLMYRRKKKAAIMCPKTEGESGIAGIKTQKLIAVGKVTLKQKHRRHQLTTVPLPNVPLAVTHVISFLLFFFSSTN